jgi:hypothetical protein
MKKTTLLSLLLLFLLSCGSVKAPEGETVIKDAPCTGQDYLSNKKYFRVQAIGSVNSRYGAKKAAKRKAMSDLIKEIESKVEVFSNMSDEIIESGEQGVIAGKIGEYNELISRERITNIREICNVTTKTNSTGMFNHYIVIEMSVKDVVDDVIDYISSDEKADIRLNHEKMRALFEEKMNK